MKSAIDAQSLLSDSFADFSKKRVVEAFQRKRGFPEGRNSAQD
jgi:hypothetical protein